MTRLVGRLKARNSSKSKGTELSNQGWFRMIGQNPVKFWAMSQVGCSRFTQCRRKRGNTSSEECRQKLANFIRLSPICLPILGKEIISFLHSIQSTKVLTVATLLQLETQIWPRRSAGNLTMK